MVILIDNECAYQYKFNPNYFITASGKIYSIYVVGGRGKTDITKPHLLSYSQDKDGYYRVIISDNTHKRYVKVHTLVVEQFIRPLNLAAGEVCNHIDGNIHNNNISNLEIVSVRYNNIHAHKMGLNGRDIKVRVQFNNQYYYFTSMTECSRYFPDLTVRYLNQIRHGDYSFPILYFEKVYPDKHNSPVKVYYNGMHFATFNSLREAEINLNLTRGSVSSAIINGGNRKKLNQYIVAFENVSTIENVSTDKVESK